MIAELQFETAVADPVFEGISVEAAEISALDATGEVPLYAALWVAENGAEADVQQALAEREALRTTTEITAGQRGGLYRVRYGNEFDGTDVYPARRSHTTACSSPGGPAGVHGRCGSSSRTATPPGRSGTGVRRPASTGRSTPSTAGRSRRGLDSLVEEALLSPSGGSLTQ